MFDILQLINGKKKRSGSGWISFNAPCCHNRGHRPDRKGRGGLKFTNNDWRYHCFNCSYSCGFELGKTISAKTRAFLKWVGCDDQQINQWSLESMGKRDLYQEIREHKAQSISFGRKALPDNAELLNPNIEEHQPFYDYLVQRRVWDGLRDFYVSPRDNGRNGNRIIIPFTYQRRTVGYTSRFCDDRTPKYINEMPTGYVYGVDQQQPDWQVCILVEGIFDAMAIDGCAYMHNTISSQQAALLGNLDRRIIVVPDQDEAGLRVCERAHELGYQVSLPHWSPDVKDVNDAVVKYGRLPTLLSIIQHASASPIKSKLRVQEIEKARTNN